MRLNNKDIEIARLLEYTTNIGKIAKRTNLSKSAVYYHLNKLKRTHAIRGYRLMLDLRENKNLMVLLVQTTGSAKISRSNLSKIIKTAGYEPLEIYEANGDWNFFTIMAGRTLKNGKNPIENIKSTNGIKRMTVLKVRRAGNSI